MDDPSNLPDPEIVEQIETIPGVPEALPEEEPDEWGDPVEPELPDQPSSPEVRSTPHG